MDEFFDFPLDDRDEDVLGKNANVRDQMHELRVGDVLEEALDLTQNRLGGASDALRGGVEFDRFAKESQKPKMSREDTKDTEGWTGTGKEKSRKHLERS